MKPRRTLGALLGGLALVLLLAACGGAPAVPKTAAPVAQPQAPAQPQPADPADPADPAPPQPEPAEPAAPAPPQQPQPPGAPSQPAGPSAPAPAPAPQSTCVPNVAIHSTDTGGTIHGAIRDSVLYWAGTRSSVECLSAVQRQLTVVGDTGEARQLNTEDAAVGYRVIRVQEPGGARYHILKYVNGEPVCIIDSTGACVRKLTALADDYELETLPGNVPGLGGSETPPAAPDTAPSWPASAANLSVRTFPYAVVELKVPAPLGNPAPTIIFRGVGGRMRGLSFDAETLAISGRFDWDVPRVSNIVLTASNSLGTADLEIPITVTCGLSTESIINYFSGSTWERTDPHPFLRPQRLSWLYRVVFNSEDLQIHFRDIIPDVYINPRTARRSVTIPYGIYRGIICGQFSTGRSKDWALIYWSGEIWDHFLSGKSAADLGCHRGPVSIAHDFRGEVWYEAIQNVACLSPAAAEPAAPAWPEAEQSFSWVAGDASSFPLRLAAPTGVPSPMLSVTGGILPGELDILTLRLDPRQHGSPKPPWRSAGSSGSFTITAANSSGTADKTVSWSVTQ